MDFVVAVGCPQCLAQCGAKWTVERVPGFGSIDHENPNAVVVADFEMPREHRELYAKHLEGKHKAIDLMAGVISSPDEIIVAIERALTDPWP